MNIMNITALILSIAGTFMVSINIFWKYSGEKFIQGEATDITLAPEHPIYTKFKKRRLIINVFGIFFLILAILFQFSAPSLT